MNLDAGDGIKVENAAWSFGGKTPSAFNDHIKKSVPDYEVGHELILDISDFFVKKDSICYELGSSTGTLTNKLAQRHPVGARWIGLDTEEEMIKESKKNFPDQEMLSFEVADVTEYSFEKADFVVAYYTIQFIRPRDRQKLIDAIYCHLNWGGAFVMFEKVRAPDARFQDIMSSLYTEFKLRGGYSPMEIISKAKSIKGVLEPFSSNANIEMLQRAGFKDIMTIYKRLSFEGFFCIK